MTPDRMNKIKTLVIMLLLLVTPALADEWKEADTTREVMYLALHVVDWGQTLNIADNPDKYHEHNPILGNHPSRGEVTVYFITTAVAHSVVSYMLPHPYREWWQYLTIGVELGATINNASVGIRVGF